MQLQDRIARRDSEILLFALTPPRASVTAERAQEIADATLARLADLDLDGLVIYDIDDESDRNPQERPFPFLPTLDPSDYLDHHLARLGVPAVVYRAVGKYTEDELAGWLTSRPADRVLTVFVGASSRDVEVRTSLARAQAISRELGHPLLLGGVAIPERHARTGEEHLRLLAKQDAGCSFFVTQVVLDVSAAKDLASDHLHESRLRGTRVPAPIVFTLTVCGSLTTMAFLRWLGVAVPRWLENDLTHAEDTLAASYDHAVATARELAAYCRQRGIPFGFNVESVSIRRAEIEAATRLAAHLATFLRR